MYKHLDRQQLIELVEKIKLAEGSEDEIADWMNLLVGNVPDPNVAEIIFFNDVELTSEEAIDKALAYKPILL